jgi:hypothetical protein
MAAKRAARFCHNRPFSDALLPRLALPTLIANSVLAVFARHKSSAIARLRAIHATK